MMGVDITDGYMKVPRRGVLRVAAPAGADHAAVFAEVMRASITSLNNPGENNLLATFRLDVLCSAAARADLATKLRVPSASNAGLPEGMEAVADLPNPQDDMARLIELRLQKEYQYDTQEWRMFFVFDATDCSALSVVPVSSISSFKLYCWDQIWSVNVASVRDTEVPHELAVIYDEFTPGHHRGYGRRITPLELRVVDVNRDTIPAETDPPDEFGIVWIRMHSPPSIVVLEVTRATPSRGYLSVHKFRPLFSAWGALGLRRDWLRIAQAPLVDSAFVE